MDAKQNTCPQCDSENIRVHQINPPRLRCGDCGQTFTPNATANADKLEAAGVAVDGNVAVAVDKGLAPPTVEELMDKYHLDPDEWIVDRVRPGTHQGFYKTPGGEHRVVTMYSLKAWLIRRNPVEVEFPIVQGATVRPWKPKVTVSKTGLLRDLIVPDAHFGYRRNMDTGELEAMHDEAAVELVAAIIREYKPDRVIMLGDNLDLPDWTDKFLVTPDCKNLTQAALDALASWIMSWRSYTGEVVYLEGNHEERMPRAITRNCAAAWNLRPANCPTSHPAMSVPNLLNLDAMGVQWIGGYPKNKTWVNENLRARHAEKLATQPGHAVGKVLQHARFSVLCGHAHTVESAHTTVRAHDGIRTYGAYCFGTLARLDDNGPPSAGEPDWQQSFGWVEYEPGNGDHQVQQVMIYNGRCIFNGKRYGRAESEVAA